MSLRVHINYGRKRYQIVALRAQTLLAVSGIPCSIEGTLNPAPESTVGINAFFHIDQRGNMGFNYDPNVDGWIVNSISRLLQAIIDLREYGKRYK